MATTPTATQTQPRNPNMIKTAPFSAGSGDSDGGPEISDGSVESDGTEAFSVVGDEAVLPGEGADVGCFTAGVAAGDRKLLGGDFVGEAAGDCATAEPIKITTISVKITALIKLERDIVE